jgi:hypothetical protein
MSLTAISWKPGLVSLICTVSEQALEQPFLLTRTASVNDPELPAVTDTGDPVVGPGMLPLPLIDQLKDEPCSELEAEY